MAAKFPDELDSSGSEDSLSICAICKDRQEKVIVLECQHVACVDCLRRYIESLAPDLDTLICPVCRSAVPIPEALEFKVTSSGPLQEFATKISKPSRRVTCDVCKYKKESRHALAHCPNCAISYCESCSKDHDRCGLFHSHAVIPVSQMDHTALRCEVHEAEQVRYYCGTCVSLLCTVCAVSDHKDHSTMELAQALGDKRQSIIRKIETMSGKVQKHEELLIQLEELQSVREAAYKKTRAEIERHTTNLMTQLQLRRESLLQEVEEAHKAGIKQVDIEKDNASVQLANMKSLWKFADKLTAPSQTVQLIKMHEELMKMADGMVRAPDPCISKECIVVQMFVPKENLNIGDISRCELSTDLLTRVSDEARSSTRSRPQSPFTPRSQSPHPSRSHSPVSFYMDGTSARWHSAKLLWKIDKTGARRGEVNEAYAVAVLDSGDIAIAEWLSLRVQVFDSTGYSKEVIAQNLLRPWGICVNTEGNLAITDEKDRTLKIYSPQGYLVTQWKKNMFGWPRGVTVNRSGQYVVTDGRSTVGLYLPDGKCLRQFGSQGSGNEQFDWPRYVTTDSEDRIIVSDSSNHCIKVLDPSGQFLFKFGSHGSNDGQLKHPRGVCVDPSDNIIVADQDNDRITLFTGEGKFVRHVVKILKPWGVAVNSDGVMAVTQKPALCVFKVFEPSFA